MNDVYKQMYKQIIIFGTNDLAELAMHYISLDSRFFDCNYFTKNKEYITPEEREDGFYGRPVIEFENIENTHPPSEYLLFAPLADNKLREKIYNEGIKKGYEFISYISPKCTNYSNEIGDNCFILEDNTLQPFVKIGNNCILWSGNHIGHHSLIKDNVFITSHVVVSGHCNIEKGAFLGVNSTLRDGITIGENSIIGMGAVVTKDVPSNETWIGFPAKKKE